MNVNDLPTTCEALASTVETLDAANRRVFGVHVRAPSVEPMLRSLLTIAVNEAHQRGVLDTLGGVLTSTGRAKP